MRILILTPYHSYLQLLKSNFDDPENGFEWKNQLSETESKHNGRCLRGENSQTFMGSAFPKFYHLLQLALIPAAGK